MCGTSELCVGYENTMCFRSVARIANRVATAKRLMVSSALVTKQMRSEDAIRAFFDQYLVARIPLRNAARGIPSGSRFILDPVLQPPLPGLAVPTQPDSKRSAGIHSLSLLVHRARRQRHLNLGRRFRAPDLRRGHHICPRTSSADPTSRPERQVDWSPSRLLALVFPAERQCADICRRFGGGCAGNIRIR